MTTTSGAEQRLGALAGAHGAGLHRLAAMLTADTWAATDLTAQALAAGSTAGSGGDGAGGDALRTHLVRRYLRAAGRRPEVVVDAAAGDAGDALLRLRPRARAAAALRLGEGWDTARTAAALGISERRVEWLVPRVPGLDLALVGLADQHALTGPELQTALADRLVEVPARARGSRRGPARLAAVAVVGALLVGYAVSGQEDGPAPADDPSPDASAGTDLTAAGWKLTEKGLPPRLAMGLVLRETATVAKGRRSTVVSLPTVSGGMGVALFGVLWCDMPPAQDDHLQVPSGTLTVDGLEIDLPCAGRDGFPPVSQVVPLPLGGDGVLQISGDAPGDGTSMLAVYAETDNPSAPSPKGERTDAPPVAEGAVVLDLSRREPSMFGGERVVEAVTVGHDSTVQVWAGRTGAVAVNVDGAPATDDGDVGAVLDMMSELTPGQLEGTEPIEADPQDYREWSTQEADLREGRWLVPVPGMVRTFALPEPVRPPPGEHRTVAVEVLTEHVGDHARVSLTAAAPADVDTAAVAALTAPDAPRLVAGHRLVGQWELPSDGLARDLVMPGPGQVPDDLRLILTRELDRYAWFGWGEGVVSRDGHTSPLWLQGDLDSALRDLPQPWHEPLPDGPGPLSVSVPPVLGHVTASVTAYAPVPYEEFDFSAAEVPPGAWTTGTPPPEDDGRYMSFDGWQVQGVAGPEDLEDGRLTLRVTPGNGLAARIATEGRGRMRFLVEGNPADALWGTDGWWSSWTDKPVTSQTDLAYPGGYNRSEIEVRVVVEDYEDFTVELLGN